MKHILIVDDEKFVANNIKEYIHHEGFQTMIANNGKEALSRLENKNFDLVLLDVRMPVMDGLRALPKILEMQPNIKIIMISAIDDLKVAQHCMNQGAYGYLTKPVDYEMLNVEIRRALDHSDLAEKVKNYQKALENKVKLQDEELETIYYKLNKSYYQTIQFFIEVLSLIDPYLSGHAHKVAKLAVMIGKKYPRGSVKIKDLEVAALLHDIVNIGIPGQIQNKSLTDLSPDERSIFVKQINSVEKSLNVIDSLIGVAKIIKSHQEWVNGKGIPNGLRHEQIPLESRIIFLCHEYDFLLNQYSRKNRNLSSGSWKKLSESVYKSMEKDVGKKYDPKVYQFMIEVIQQENITPRIVKNFSLSELKNGMVLANNVIAQNGLLLCVKDGILTDVQISRLRTHDKMVSAINHKVVVYADNPSDYKIMDY